MLVDACSEVQELTGFTEDVRVPVLRLGEAGLGNPDRVDHARQGQVGMVQEVLYLDSVQLGSRPGTSGPRLLVRPCLISGDLIAHQD